MKQERNYQSDLIHRIKDRYPGSIVLKNDASHKRGIPDLTVLYKNKWAVLECKQYDKASHRPGQDKYISEMNAMSYASFISPDNEEDVFNEMDEAFEIRRTTRVSRS
jgi:hypothetical protein